VEATHRPFYVLFRNNSSGEFPMYRTTEGKIALMAFSSSASALTFANDKGMSSQWRAEEFDGVRFLNWLREQMQRNGASELAIDPEAATSSRNATVIPILALLIEAEGAGSA
jgi:hypothetical protein